jgi:hypothetical protein
MQWNQMVALVEMHQGIWRAEAKRVQAENEYVHADTLKEALAIHSSNRKMYRFAWSKEVLNYLKDLPLISPRIRGLANYPQQDSLIP